MSLDFKNPEIQKHMMEGYFGLEKESLRVTPEGFLSRTKHPFPDDPHMERDFCESQTELITGVKDSVDGVWEALAALQKKAVNILLRGKAGKEYLWPFSNPPYLPDETKIPIASYKGELEKKTKYREYLAEKYGRRKMLFSGIHFNFSFSEAFLEAGFKESCFSAMRDYKDRLYLELAKKVTRYSWLIVYLTAASPVLDGSYFQKEDAGTVVLKNLASPRCSKIGYWNDFVPVLSYDSLENYTKSIEYYVKQGQLREPAELYYPVRLKPAGENSLDHLNASGVNHIELRMLDLNPLEPVGIKKEDLSFLHLFLLYLTSLEDQEFWPFEQTMAVKNEKRAAKYDEQTIRIETGWNSSIPVRYAALQVLANMKQFFEGIGKEEFRQVIQYQEEKIICPKKRYAVRVRELFQEEYVKKGVALAEQYARGFDENR